MSEAGEVLGRTREEIAAVAAERNLICIFPEENELLLDLDDGPEMNEAVQKVLRENEIHFAGHLRTQSPGGNVHLYLKVKPHHLLHEFDVTDIGPLTRIILQVCLGSDPTREFLSFCRYQSQSEAPTALFETPDQAKLVIAWRAKLNDSRRRK